MLIIWSFLLIIWLYGKIKQICSCSGSVISTLRNHFCHLKQRACPVKVWCTKIARILRITYTIQVWRNWPALFVRHQYLELGHFCLPVSPVAKSIWQNWQASTGHPTFACRQAKFWSESKTFLLAVVQNVLAKHEMFEKFGVGETSKKGQAVETMSSKQCWSISPGLYIWFTLFLEKLKTRRD